MSLPSDPAPDPDLLARMRRGDEQAARLFDAAFRGPLARLCLGYLGRPEDADDAVQEVLAKVLRSEAAPAELRPWLFRIARNHCLNVRRDRARRDGAALPGASRLAEVRTGFLTRLVRGERMERVELAFAALAESEQEALRLRYGEDLSRREIAAITGAPESTVKSRLFEGLRKLRERLAATDG